MQKENSQKSNKEKTMPPENDGVEEIEPSLETSSELQSKLTAAYSKHEDLQSKYLRVFADLENLKKRSIRDREEAIQRSRLQIIEDLLPVLDSFKIGMDEALKNDPNGPIVNGFKMALEQFNSILNDYGLVCIEASGETFDPKFHEAIGYEEGPEDDIVIRAIRPGYRVKDKLIRPASVIIAKNTIISNSEINNES